MYLYKEEVVEKPVATIRLLGSGAMLNEVLHAAQLLAEDWNVASEIWSVTSFTELARDAQATQRFNRLNPNPNPKFSCVASQLPGDTPIVAVTDYLAALPQLIASHVKAPFSALGTDGFGRSDTRPQLRDFFEVDSKHIVLSALTELLE